MINLKLILYIDIFFLFFFNRITHKCYQYIVLKNQVRKILVQRNKLSIENTIRLKTTYFDNV